MAVHTLKINSARQIESRERERKKERQKEREKERKRRESGSFDVFSVQGGALSPANRGAGRVVVAECIETPTPSAP